jgi:hypothetical protein
MRKGPGRVPRPPQTRGRRRMDRVVTSRDLDGRTPAAEFAHELAGAGAEDGPVPATHASPRPAPTGSATGDLPGWNTRLHHCPGYSGNEQVMISEAAVSVSTPRRSDTRAPGLSRRSRRNTGCAAKYRLGSTPSSQHFLRRERGCRYGCGHLSHARVDRGRDVTKMPAGGHWLASSSSSQHLNPAPGLRQRRLAAHCHRRRGERVLIDPPGQKIDPSGADLRKETHYSAVQAQAAWRPCQHETSTSR